MSVSSRFGWGYGVDGGSKDFTRVFCCNPETILQLTTFGLWNHMDFMSHTSSLSLVTNLTPPYTPPAAVATALKHMISYPRQFFKYTASRILVSFRSMRS